MSAHRPLAEVQAERPRFEAVDFVKEQNPQLDWKVGDGANNRTDLLNHAAFTECDPASFTKLDPAQMIADGKASDVYKLMIGVIVPRPIAFCSTISADGVKNLAPFSWFQMLSHNPPIIMVSIAAPKGGLKDTAGNILATKEFVVNIISEPFVEAANYTSVNAPADIDEWQLSGLTQMPSTVVKPARVGEAAVAMECTYEDKYELKDDSGKLTGVAIFGRVKLFHVRSDLFVPGQGTAVDIAKLMPVSRLGGISYARTDRMYDLDRMAWSSVENEARELLDRKKPSGDKSQL